MKLDRNDEFESNPAYRRILAELPPDERLRLLGHDFDLQRQLHKKSEYRRVVQALPVEKKLVLLEELRKRAELQRGKRRVPPIPKAPRFGGRSTASGVSYEEEIAAFLAVKMLSGSHASVWEGINGGDITAITMQASEPVDDIVVTLYADDDARAYISAKERSGTIPLTTNSPAFSGTIRAFVRQFLAVSSEGPVKSRFIWAVPSAAGRAATRHLSEVLDTHRMQTTENLSGFVKSLQPAQGKAFKACLAIARDVWQDETGTSPTEEELKRLLGRMYVEVYDFGYGQRFERQAETEIRTHIAADPTQAATIWQNIKLHFREVNRRGLRVTPLSLRASLSADGLVLKSRPDYSNDVARLHDLTTRHLKRLQEHTSLPFGSEPGDKVHIYRGEDLSALSTAAKAGHLLITGEPGSGKSGLIHGLAETLQQDGVPVVLLLAEEVFNSHRDAPANPLKLSHGLDDVLGHWPNGERGILITDALDAIRDTHTQKRLHSLLRDVLEGTSGWNVVASIREFDLKYGRQVRELFPGTGVPGYESIEFAEVAHFHVPRLKEALLDELIGRRTEVHSFIESARRNPKSAGIHRVPFYLRLAAELLRAGVSPERLGDWSSPAILLRRFWDVRVKDAPNSVACELALQAICRRMVETRSMAVSMKEMTLSEGAYAAIRDLRSGGILQAPPSLYGMSVGEEELRFTHHLLHDYSIARTSIPSIPQRFCAFVKNEPLLPVFYRQSFLFALEELWDAEDSRAGFWKVALELEGVPDLHSITRILAPVLAARRVESLTDLAPLLKEISSNRGSNAAAVKALEHLASGIQDVDAGTIKAAASTWSIFAQELARMLPLNPSVESPLVHIVARLNPLWQ